MSVIKGGMVDVMIRQGNTSGAGPYACDMDLTSIEGGVDGADEPYCYREG